MYRDEHDFALSKSLVPIDRTHVFQGNFLWQPFSGRNKIFGKEKNGPARPHRAGRSRPAFPGFSAFRSLLRGIVGNVTLCYTALGVLHEHARPGGALPSNLAQVVKGNGYVQYFPI